MDIIFYWSDETCGCKIISHHFKIHFVVFIDNLLCVRFSGPICPSVHLSNIFHIYYFIYFIICQFNQIFIMWIHFIISKMVYIPLDIAFCIYLFIYLSLLFTILMSLQSLSTSQAHKNRNEITFTYSDNNQILVSSTYNKNGGTHTFIAYYIYLAFASIRHLAFISDEWGVFFCRTHSNGPYSKYDGSFVLITRKIGCKYEK